MTINELLAEALEDLTLDSLSVEGQELEDS